MNGLLPREASEPAPGAVHIPDWLDLERQRELVETCREWARGPIPIASPTLPSGHSMSLQMVCLGWYWKPYRYVKKAEEGGPEVLPFPEWLKDLARDGLAAAYGPGDVADRYAPDAALVNFYDAEAKLGMHQDKDERAEAPVVSISLGDSCVFRFGNPETRNRPYTDIELRSGDLFVFGGPSRLSYHGVTKVLPGTADPRLGMTSGRLNITIRETGLG